MVHSLHGPTSVHVIMPPICLFMNGGGAVGLSGHRVSKKVECSNPGHNRPTPLKQVVTAPLLNARQQVRVSRVLGNDNKTDFPCHSRCDSLKAIVLS